MSNQSLFMLFRRVFVNNTSDSVTIPVHPYFAEKKQVSEKEEAYRSRIIEALKEKPLSKNELAKALG